MPRNGTTVRAAEYANKLVVEDGIDQGRYWLKAKKEYWLTFRKEEDYGALERFGFDRGTDVSPSEGAGVATLEAQMISLQKTVDDLRAGEKTLEALKQNYELQKMIDELREICEEGRAGAGTLDELMTPLQKLVHEMRAGDGPLEALKQGIQKIGDEVRAGETLEALKQGILNRKQITGDGTLVCKEYPEEPKDNGKYSGASAGDGTLEALKQGAGDYELQKRVDEMRELQTLIDDLRAGDKTLEALSLSHYELQQMAHDMREMCAAVSGGGVGILEEQMNALQKIGDEMRAGETLEALKQGILNRKQIIGEGTMVLQ